MLRRITRCLSMGDLRLSSAVSTRDRLSLSFGNIILLMMTLGLGGMAAQMRASRLTALRLRAEGAPDYDKIV